MAEDFDYRSVLRKALGKLLDILDPVPILDQFTQDAFLPDVTIRDIREETTTTKKIRAIVENVKNKGPKGYRKFKRFLRNAHQGHVADYLETIEKKVGTGHNQAPKPRMESQTSDEGAGTLNIGGKGSVNSFGGQTNLGNVNIGWQTTDGSRKNTRSEGDSRSRGQLQMDGVPYGAYGAKVTNIGGDGAINNFGGVVNVSGTLNLGAGGDRGSPMQTVKPSQQHVPAHSYQHQPPTNHPMSQQNPSDAIRSQPGQFFQVVGQAPPNYSISQLNQPDAIRSKPGHFYGNSGQAPSSSGQSGPYIPGQNEGYITGQSGQPFYGGNQPLGNYAHFPQGGHPSLNAPGYYAGYTQQPGQYLGYTQGAQPPSGHLMYQQVPANNQLAGVPSSHYQPMPPMNQPSSGHYQQMPAANQPPSGQHQQMPSANQSPSGQHQQMPAANQSPSGQHQQMPAENQPPSGHYQQMPAANQPPSGQHQQMPAANQSPSAQHQQVPAANQPPSGQHQQMPAANQPPSSQHQPVPADNQNEGNSSTFQEGNSLQNLPDPCQLIQGKPTQNVPDTRLFPEQGIVGQTQPQQTTSLPKSMEPNEEVSIIYTRHVDGNVPDDKTADSNKGDEARNTELHTNTEEEEETQQHQQNNQPMHQPGRAEHQAYSEDQTVPKHDQEWRCDELQKRPELLEEQQQNRQGRVQEEQKEQELGLQDQIASLSNQLKSLREQSAFKGNQEVLQKQTDILEQMKGDQEQMKGQQEQQHGDLKEAILKLTNTVIKQGIVQKGEIGIQPQTNLTNDLLENQVQHQTNEPLQSESLQSEDRSGTDNVDANLVGGYNGNQFLKPNLISPGHTYSLSSIRSGSSQKSKPNQIDDTPLKQLIQPFKDIKIEGIHVPPSPTQSDVNRAVCHTEDEYQSDVNTEDDISDIQSGLPPTSYEETKTVRKDVDDGRILTADGKWLESIIKGGKKLRNGSSGNVYCSNEEEIEKKWGIRIVVKKIKCTEDKYKSVINEKIAARIRHQSIVPLLANCPQYKNHFYLVFPFMEKGDLMNAIKEDMDRLKSRQKAKMEARERVFILYQIACAMLFIHTPVTGLRGKVFHGDITTRNIVRGRNGSARLLDFGVSQELKSADEVIYAQTGDLIGTPGYTTVASKKELSPMTDCRNLGVVILEMLTGDVPKRGNRELQKVNLRNLERLYYECYEKVWKKNDKVYGELKKMAEQCLKKKINAEEISKSLHDILEADFVHNWEPKKDDKCSMCILNHAVPNSHNLFLNGCENRNDHIAPPVCVACMRNSYLNPIQCQRCRNTIRTRIGTSWGAILIEGFDKKKENQEVFSKDIENMEKILTSKYPLFIGISPKNVFKTKMDKASEAVDRIKNEDSIKTVFIYYSGHYHKQFGFQTGKDFQTDKDKFMKEEAFQECFKSIRAEQDIILVMDCCYSGSLKDSLPQIKLQLSATRSEEKSTFNRGGSLFTRLFIQSLRAKSTRKPCICLDEPGGTCSTCSAYCPEATQSGFISVSALFYNISEHMAEYCRKNPIEGYFPTLVLNMTNNEANHLFIAYHIQDVTHIKLTCEDKGCCSIEELPCEMNELQMMLLEHVLKNSYKGDWSSYWHEYEQLWQKYSGVIGVGIRTGPHPEHYQDLKTIPLVTDAWNKKLELQFGLRPVCNIKDGKVGMFMNDIKTEELMDNFLKSHHFNELLTLEMDDRRLTRVTIPWVNIADFKVMDVLKTLKPTGLPALESGYEQLMEIWMALVEDQSLENAENLIMTIPSELRNPSFQFTENFFTMEIQYKAKPAENEEMSTNDS